MVMAAKLIFTDNDWNAHIKSVNLWYVIYT